MKRSVLIAVLAAMVFAVPTWAAMPLTIGAESVGYGANAASQGSFFTNYWAGLKVYAPSDKSAAYVSYQHLGENGGFNGDGVKAILLSGSNKVPGFYLIADVGVAWDLAQNGDGTPVAAFTTGGGLAFAASELLSPFVYGSAYDAGPDFKWSVHFGLAITDIQTIFGIKK